MTRSKAKNAARENLGWRRRNADLVDCLREELELGRTENMSPLTAVDV